MDEKKRCIHAQRIRTLARIVAIFSIILIAPHIYTAQVQALEEPILYAGVSNPASVYRYTGDTTWTLIGTFPEDYAVLCLVDYGGELYAGTTSSTPPSGIGRVYRYTGGTTWTLVGDGMDNQVACLVVYSGNLYAGTAWNSGRLYRYDGGTTWTMVVDHEGTEDWTGFRSAHVYGDILVLGDIALHLSGHYDGTTFTYDAFSISYCEGYWDFEVYNEHLFASAGNGIDLAVSSDGTTWGVAIPADWPDSTVRYKNVWELETFGDKLYMGLDNGTLQTWDGSIHSNVLDTPDGQGITAMETSFYYGKLFLGVGEEAGSSWSSPTDTGKIYSYDGTTFQLISGDLGTGIQVLYARAREGSDVIIGSIVDWWFTLGFWFSGAIFMWWLYYKWSPPVPPGDPPPGDPYRSILLSVIGGVVITLLTVFIPIRSLAGATHYGLPLAWRIRLALHPQYNPWRINIPYLIDDIVIWSLIVGVVIFFIRRRWSGGIQT